MKYTNKNLLIENIKIKDLAKKYGTPIYCYSHKQLKENINNFKKNFRSFSPLVCFAVKSNTNVNLF
jgi:diaminopimelate decarboxylase